MSLAVSRKFRAAAHGVWSIFVCRYELVGVCRNSDDSYNQQKSRSCEETAKLRASFLIYAQAYQLSQSIDEDDDREIVSYLDMVGLYLHAEGKGEKHRSEDGLRKP